jgi:hypothetical protein
MNGTSMNALVGGAGNDTFTLASAVPTFNGSIAGGGGTDTLAATDGANAWQVTERTRHAEYDDDLLCDHELGRRHGRGHAHGRGWGQRLEHHRCERGDGLGDERHFDERSGGRCGQ